MELRTLSCRLEPIFHQAFGSIGLFLARRGGTVALLTTILLIALSFGLFTLEVESDAIELTVSRRGRIHREKEYYEDHFNLISPELSSFIITPKSGHSLLNTRSLYEVAELQNWIRTFTFEASRGLNVSLEQFCFKSVDSEAWEPCYQASILDCFAEGAVFNVGGDKNSEYSDFYATRKSFKELDFQEEFNASFVQEECRSWTGTPTSIPLIMSEVNYEEDGSTIADVGALQVAFGTRSAEALVSRGLEFVDWIATSRTEERGQAVCPDVSKCEPCADALEASRFLRSGCRLGSQDQPGSCCDELALVRQSPCVETIFERQPTAGDIANPLFSACGIDRVELTPRCTNHLLMHGNNTQSFPEEEEVVDSDICNCLRNQNSSECTQSIAAMSSSYPELNTVFVGDDGSPASQESITEYLEETFDCVNEGSAPTMELPEVCICLEDRTSDNCRSAATAYALENPQYIQAFTAASQDDPEAVQEIASLLSTICRDETGSTDLTPELDISSTTNSDSMNYKPTVRIIKELTSTLKEAEDLLHDWELAWKEAIVSKMEDFETIDVTWVSSRSLNDAAKDAANAQSHLIAMGYLLILLYVIGYFAFERKEGRIVFSTLPPGPVSAALSFLCVLLGVSATFGVLSLFSLTSFKATATTIQIVPLLTVGLGVNDLFVLVSALLTVLDRKKDLDKIMFEAMAIGGTSITLSSVANTTAFALGMLSPIPVVLWFSFQMMIGVLIAYLVSMTIIPSILAAATSRWLKNETENIQKETRIQSEVPGSCPCQGTPQEDSELAPKTGQCPSRWYQVVLLMVLLGYCVWLGVSIVGITKLEQGLNLSEAVKKDSELYKYLIQKERYFQSYSINLVFSSDQDYSNPDTFAESRSTEFHFIEDGYKTDKKAGVLSWFDFYTKYVESKLCSNEICLTEVNWYYDHLSSEAFGDPNRNLCSKTANPEDCEILCSEYCPQGPITTQFKCRLSENKESCYCPWKPMLKPYLFFENPVGFDSKVESYWSDFLTNTSNGLAARNLIDFKEESKTERNLFGVPEASRSLAYVNEMLTTGERLRHIKQSRHILDNTQVEVYPFDYVVFAMGEQYDDLGLRTVTAVGISLAIATVVMIPLIASWITAFLVALCIGSGIVLSAGTIHWLDLKLNYASYVSLIVAVGLMLEFCAHIARDFMLAEGDRITRSRHAIKTMGVAVLNGGITTFLGLLPVALSSYGYFQKYYFVQYSVVVSVGLLTGLVLLPVVLALIGPPSFMSTFTSKTNIEKSNGSLAVL